MRKIFLISSNTTTEPYPVYPLGMATVAAALTRSGHLVEQFDYFAADRSEAQLGRSIEAFAPEFVGISLRNIDNVDSLTPESAWYLARTKHLVELIRKAVKVPIIVGGPAFSIMPEEILEYIQADHGITGEGELALCRLIDDLADGRSAPRIINGSAPPLAGEQMMSPLYKKNLVGFYMEKSGVMNVQTKRGCPHNCTYCTYPSLEGNRFRPRDPDAVVEDLIRLQTDFGVNSVFFTDSVFNDAAGLYLDVVEAICRREVKLRWSAFFRPQGIGVKELSLMQRSGLYAMEVGTDAASDATLRGLNKKFTIGDVIKFQKICIEHQMPAAHFIMFGGPNETLQTVNEGLANIEHLGQCVVFAFSGIRILPGTGVHRRAVDDGLLTADAPLLKPVYYFSPHVDVAKMNANIEAGFQGRRDRVFPPSEGQMRMQAMHLFGHRGLLWDQLISFKPKTRMKKSA